MVRDGSGCARPPPSWHLSRPSPCAGKRVAYFRGRELEGHEVRLPDGVLGVVAHEVAASLMTPDKVGEPPKRLFMADLLDEDDDEYEGGYSGGGGGFANLRDDDDGLGGDEEEGGGVQQAGAPGGGRGVGGHKRGRGEEEDGSAASANASAASASGLRRNWAVDGTFTTAMYWLHDRPSGEGDVLPSALEWVHAARALHADVTDEDVALLGGGAGAAQTPAKP